MVVMVGMLEMAGMNVGTMRAMLLCCSTRFPKVRSWVLKPGWLAYQAVGKHSRGVCYAINGEW